MADLSCRNRFRIGSVTERAELLCPLIAGNRRGAWNVQADHRSVARLHGVAVQPTARAADACAEMRPGLNHIVLTSGGRQQQIDLLLPASFEPTKRSVERAAARWASLDRCGATPALEKAAEHATRVRYGACSASSEVELYRIDAPRNQGGGHVWPGGQRDLSTRAPSASAISADGAREKPALEVDATALVLEFFARH